MRFMISDGVKGIYGGRVWLEKEFDKHGLLVPGFVEACDILDRLSVWGGHDSQGANFRSWEFPWLDDQEVGDQRSEAVRFLLMNGFSSEDFELVN